MSTLTSPTVPTDIGNQRVMRAWYQSLRKSLEGIVLSVKDYGAVGNGSVDDTQAFNKALADASNNHNVLYIPAGNYKVTEGFSLTSDITIYGEGTNLSIIEPHFDASDTYVFQMTAGGYLKVLDIGFEGTDVSNPTPTNHVYMIDVAPSSGTLENIYIHDVRFVDLNMTNGIYGTDPDADLRVTHCIKIKDTDYVRIGNCYAKDVSGSFVYTTGVNHLIVEDNYLEDVDWYPVRLNDNTHYVDIKNNHFNPTDSNGVIFGGLIDIASEGTSNPCEHINITGNKFKGTDNTTGYVSYGAVIRALSTSYLNISDNHFGPIQDGTRNNGSNFAEVPNIKIGVAGTSSSDDNGPGSHITISNNFMEGDLKNTSAFRSGIFIENDFQTSANPIESVKIIGNHIQSTDASYIFTHGITLNGKSSGIKNVTIEDNTIRCNPTGAATNTTGRGLVSFVSDNATGKCNMIFVGGNRIENLLIPSNVEYSCLVIGQYTSEVMNTKPNYLEGGEYGVVIETGAGNNLFGLDDQIVEQWPAESLGDFLFNVQPDRIRHTNRSGSTANRPSTTTGRVDYMTYFDTTVGNPMWYDGSNWINALGSTATTTEFIEDTAGAMFTGNTETGITATYQDGDGTVDLVVDDLTVAGDTGSTDMTPGDTLTVTGGIGIDTAMSGDTLTLTADLNELTTETSIASGDFLAMVDITDNGSGKITFANLESALNHDSLTGFVANEHIDWTNATDSFYTSGQVSLGTENETSITIGGSSFNACISAHVESATDFDYMAHRHSDTASAAAAYVMGRSRGTGAAETVVVTGDRLGEIAAVGHDGTDFAFGARIQFDSTGTIGANTIPTNITFKTAPDGGGAPTTALVIKENNDIDLSASANLTFNGTAILADSAGTMTLSNIDSIDATTEATLKGEFLANDGDVGTGTYDFGGATSFEIPNSATPTVDAAGEIAIDTTITDHTGLITYHDGTEALYVVGIPTANLSSTDGHVIAYNATNNEFEMVAQAASSPTQEPIQRSWFGI